LNLGDVSDSRSEFAEALEDLIVDLENPPVVKITVNPQIYGIDQVRHLKIMVCINGTLLADKENPRFCHEESQAEVVRDLGAVESPARVLHLSRLPEAV
jgi:hypothetical protein